MNLFIKALFNRWRRRLWRALFFRIRFGEFASGGGLLAHSRIAPSSCIEGEQGLVLTPARLRLSSGLVLAYTTSTWLPHAVFLALVLLKVG